jgi:hypothetical protein
MVPLFFLSTAIACAGEIRQSQVVGDLEIVMTVPHADESPGARVESQEEHHLVIWLFDRTSGRPIADAEVKAGVAEAGYGATEKMLRPSVIEGKPAYNGLFIMPSRALYRINIQVRRPGVRRSIGANFEYRHHHKLE